MEKNSIEKTILELKGYELSRKIKEILLGKFKNKKKFLQTPSIENSALRDITDYVFDKYVEEYSGGKNSDRQENYKQNFTLNIKEKDLIIKIWKIVESINEYQVVSEGTLSRYAYNLFKVEEKDLKTLNRRLQARAKDRAKKIVAPQNKFLKTKPTPSESWLDRWEKEKEN